MILRLRGEVAEQRSHLLASQSGETNQVFSVHALLFSCFYYGVVLLRYYYREFCGAVRDGVRSIFVRLLRL